MRGTYLLMTALPLEQRPDNSLDNMLLLKPNKLYLLRIFLKVNVLSLSKQNQKETDLKKEGTSLLC